MMHICRCLMSARGVSDLIFLGYLPLLLWLFVVVIRVVFSKLLLLLLLLLLLWVVVVVAVPLQTWKLFLASPFFLVLASRFLFLFCSLSCLLFERAEMRSHSYNTALLLLRFGICSLFFLLVEPIGGRGANEIGYLDGNTRRRQARMFVSYLAVGPITHRYTASLPR
ncbi:hypothetical protein B0T22DRAFT_156596 [Podospora appendiculata]|uniref:Uncharacterized protein n=1 Tax=Podospora appendiculata TaxID=314037 RepID=A0AAE0WY95_9PEZI|nr:hypothetical protein B0T22DRAFT_118793 [Podospora appendiculata]KAK3688532.1 hypothetical protein B0T22DRAFT_156596 [Podospora appendiculata]